MKSQEKLKNNNQDDTESSVIEAVVNNPELVDQISRRPEIQQATIQILSQHSGPLPSAVDLAHYDALIPNGADRIMKLTENQQQMSFEIAKQEQSHKENELSLISRGQHYGFSLAVLFMLIAAFLIVQGFGIAGVTMLVTEIAGLVALFLFSAKNMKNNSKK